jgi:CelD/BcsL family acetyltransferase involved in cellulose biosynthesis
VVLVGAALEHVARDGAREVDFLRGAEDYKYRWGAIDRVQHRIRVERRTR